MKSLSPIDKIDIVLSIFQPSDYILEYGLNKQLIRAKLLNEKQVNLGERLLDEILFKLEKDGYLRSETKCHVIRDGNIYRADPKIYKLSFEGELFLNKGSYNGEVKKAIFLSRREHIQTLILTYGTAAAGMYGLYEILKWIFHHEHWKLFF